MGIQSGLNQLFAASIGAGFAISQSTGVKQIAENRIARKQADKEYAIVSKEAQGATQVAMGRNFQLQEELKKGVSKEKAEKLIENAQKADMQAADASVKKAEVGLKRAEVYNSQGKQLPERKKELQQKSEESGHEVRDFAGAGYRSAKSELAKAYKRKEEVLKSVEERRKLIKDLENIRKEILKK